MMSKMSKAVRLLSQPEAPKMEPKQNTSNDEVGEVDKRGLIGGDSSSVRGSVSSFQPPDFFSFPTLPVALLQERKSSSIRRKLAEARETGALLSPSVCFAVAARNSRQLSTGKFLGCWCQSCSCPMLSYLLVLSIEQTFDLPTAALITS